MIKMQDKKLDKIITDYSSLFEGIGRLEFIYDIKLKENTYPVVEPPRKIPIGIEENVKLELDRMEKLGIIRKVTEPTEWVS